MILEWPRKSLFDPGHHVAMPTWDAPVYRNRIRMMQTTDLSNNAHEMDMQLTRRMLVLRAIVEDYIRSQEPVGSTSLRKRHDLNVSSATIRNDMASLEEDGYIIQPHTSAGRVPTEKGYRYFVDRLATVVPLSRAQRRGIQNFLSGSASLEDVLQRAAKLLTEITGQVAVVASPALSKSTLRHVEIVQVASTVLLVVVITDSGRVAQHMLNVESIPAEDTLERFCSIVNTRCSGRSLARTAQTVRDMIPQFDQPALNRVAHALADAFDTLAGDEQAGQLYMAGTSRLAHQRSLKDLAALFDALEEQAVLMRLMGTLSEEASADGIAVAIGSETHTPGLLNASVVTGGYGYQRQMKGEFNACTDIQVSTEMHDEHDGPLAFVGSIGPTHMDYATTMAAVRAVARYLTEFIADEPA